MVAGIDKVWFEDRIRARKTSQRQLAKLMGMDASAMSLMLNGKRRMRAKEAADVAGLLGVPVDEVLRHAGAPVAVDKRRNVPVVGYVGQDGAIEFGRAMGPRTAIAPSDCGEDCQAVRVQSGTALDGWLLFYQPMEGVSLEAVGRLCVVKTAEGEDLVRVVGRGYEPGFFVLQRLLGGDSEHVRLRSACPVLWVRQ
ncbi:cI-like putative transcriptional regulator [Ralstonia phage RpY1]|nr:cI-like putative transcriptional regulator [Ralstonia phage RpY1]